MQEIPAIFPDRVIMVRGSIENMSLAEAAISVILRECIEKNSRTPVSKRSSFYVGFLRVMNFADRQES